MVATNGSGGYGETVLTHEPQQATVQARYPDANAALDAMVELAPILDLTDHDVARLRAARAGEEPMPFDVYFSSRVQDWLSMSLRFTEHEDHRVRVVLNIYVGMYHDAAIDRVLHDGTVRLDARHRPSREQLGFRDTYGTADIHAEPDERLILALTGPEGRTRVPMDSMMSSSGDPDAHDLDPAGDKPPGSTIVHLTGTNAEIADFVRGVSTALGLPADRAAQGVAAGGKHSWSTTIPAAKVVLDTGTEPDRTDRFAAGATLRIRWR